MENLYDKLCQMIAEYYRDNHKMPEAIYIGFKDFDFLRHTMPMNSGDLTRSADNWEFKGIAIFEVRCEFHLRIV